MDTTAPGRSTSGPTADPGSPVEQLERQMQRASFFSHASLQLISTRLDALETAVSQLLEQLSGRGLAERRPQEDPSPPDPDAIRWPGIAIRMDSEQDERRSTVEVNCAERMHVCHAVCCKMPIPLSAEEVESGKTKWDLGHPYMIRQEADGYCTHNDRPTGHCTIYGDRPKVCRRYSCADDNRIWKDFDRMVLNQEWIDANLPATGRVFIQTTIHRMDRPPASANGSPPA